MLEIVYALVWVIVWWVIAYFFSQKKENEQLVEKANKLNEINKKLNDTGEDLRKKELEWRQIIDSAKKESEKLKEESLNLKVKAESKLENLEFKEKDLEKKELQFDKKIEDFLKEKDEFKERKRAHEEKIKLMNDEQVKKLEQIAKLTEKEAHDKLLKETEKRTKKILLGQINKIEEELKEEAENKAKKIIGLTIQKYASEVASESTITVVNIESDELKWRIIWREWRNINALEAATWVDIIIDDTPNSIMISWFDLFRRFIAKRSLEKLIEDWRIHPAHIEQVVDKVRNEANKMLKDLWEKALNEIWIAWVHPDLIKIMWRLRFRTSYGQNILKHSLEVWYICAGLAGELWVDTEKAKMAWFFHDIWKAVDHEIEWSHALIWYEILKKYKISEDIAHAVWAHHNDLPIESPLDFIVCAADAISWARPWARRETMETYIKRLKTLEDISLSYEWVEKAFAIQAWREIRIMVKPEEVDDYEAKNLALKITEKIENDMSYPWQIKVNVIRETRASEYAK